MTEPKATKAPRKPAVRKRITLPALRDMPPDSLTNDTEVRGFAARRRGTKDITFLVRYRTADNRSRWHVIGRAAQVNVETARAEARRILADVVKGKDPSAEKQERRHAATVAELCRDYLADAKAGRLLTKRGKAKKASTLYIDQGRVDRHIVPLLGAKPVATVTRQDVRRFLHDVASGKTAGEFKTGKHGVAKVRGGETTATRCTTLLGAIFTYGIERGLRADNPVHGVETFADGKRDRRLSDDEYARLGKALALAVEAGPTLRKGQPRGGAKGPGTVNPAAIAAVRFMVLTGWRKGEVLGLRRGEMDAARRTARLKDTKSGESIRPLPRAALDTLAGLDTPADAKGLVFASGRSKGTMTGFRRTWQRIAKLGDLPADVTPHVLRHSLASLAADLGFGESTIGALIGHKGRTTTSRYTHHADAVLLAAADAVAQRTLELMGEAPAAQDNVRPLLRAVG